MKLRQQMKLLFIGFALLFTFSAQSQDIIIFNSGDTLECKILGVNNAGIHANTDEGRMTYEKEDVESYRYRKAWVQVAGPVAENTVSLIDMSSREQMGARLSFERSLNSAGTWFITGVVVSTLLVGGSFLIGDQTQALPLLITGAVTMPLSFIIAGAKLKKASRAHKLINLE